MNTNIAILLTACVNPEGMIYTKLQDPEIRKQHYLESLKFYIEKTVYKIVLIENSLYPLENEIRKYIDSGRLEYMTFDGNNFDKIKGKGYGEGLIIKYALENSAFIKKTDYIIKITGRLIIKNINKLIWSSFLFYSKKQEYVFTDDILYNGQYILIRSEFIIASKKFYSNYLLTNTSMINDSKGIIFERILVNSIISWKKDGYRHRLLMFPVFRQGISGGHLTEYKPPTFRDRIDSLRNSFSSIIGK